MTKGEIFLFTTGAGQYFSIKGLAQVIRDIPEHLVVKLQGPLLIHGQEYDRLIRELIEQTYIRELPLTLINNDETRAGKVVISRRCVGNLFDFGLGDNPFLLGY